MTPPGATAFPNPDPFRDEETQTRCPLCMPRSPKDPSAGGFGVCVCCEGKGTIVRFAEDGRYKTSRCPLCLNGKCKACKGTGMCSASRAAAITGS